MIGAHVHDLSGLSALEWVIVGVSSVGVAWVFWLAVRLTLRPGEDDPDHVKRSILEDDHARTGQ